MSKRFEIIYYTTDDDSYMYSDTSYYWHVASLQTGDEIARYSGSQDESASGSYSSGTQSVSLDEATNEAIINYYDKITERLELPENVELTDEGNAILLTYKDGRQETRERRAVIYTTKYGEPIRSKLIGLPIKLRCLVLGATGLVGSKLVQQLLVDKKFSEVRALSRRSSKFGGKKFKETLLFDLGQMDTESELFYVEVVFCCLGTTLKKFGSRKNFIQVDYAYSLNAAKLARKAGVKNFVLISSVGASPAALPFYTRIKGEIEWEIFQLKFPHFYVVRPSLLDGERQESRPLETLSILVTRLFSPFFQGSFKRYRVTSVSELATLMRTLAKNEPSDSYIEHHHYSYSPRN